MMVQEQIRKINDESQKVFSLAEFPLSAMQIRNKIPSIVYITNRI